MKNLLYAGAIAPVTFIVTFLIEGATRAGYNPWLMYVSQLSTGPGGWVQVANFLVFGVSMLVFAVGLRSSLAGTRGSVGGPVLLALFAIAMLVAGLFTTDPGLGYPVGAPPVHTLHGTIHGFAGLSVFTLLPAAALVMAWHFATAERAAAWTLYSIAVAVALIVLFFGGFAVGAVHDAPTGLFQRITIITGWTWIAALAWRQLRGRQALPARHRLEIEAPAPTVAA